MLSGGMLKRLVLVLLAAVVAALVVQSLPDIRRYLRIRRM
ncbi:DUF6893 family small protein [Microbispora hainanensis]